MMKELLRMHSYNSDRKQMTSYKIQQLAQPLNVCTIRELANWYSCSYICHAYVSITSLICRVVAINLLNLLVTELKGMLSD